MSRFGLVREGCYRYSWSFDSRWLDLSWEHFNPDYGYKRVLYLRVGNLIFSVGWAGR